MDFRKALIQSRKLPAQHIESLWETIYKHNKVKTDTLSSIVTFYMHHRVYPPPVQRAFDTLLMTFTDSKVPKKMKVLLFQTIEEMCHWLSSSCVLETVRLSTSPSVVAELLPCFLTSQDIPLPETAVYERLTSALTSPGLTQDDRTKVLGFLMDTLPSDLQPLLNKQLTAWLSYSRTPQTAGSLFRSPDVTEVDGSPGMGICTALTLVSTVTDLHVLSVVAFSNIRNYLYHSFNNPDNDLINAVFSYCSTLLTQASKKPSNAHDRHLISAVLEEVLLIVKAIREVDSSCRGRCQLTVSNIQLLAEQLRSTSLLVSVWEYHLSQDGESPLTEKMLSTVINTEFSQGAVSQALANTLACNRLQLAPWLAQYTPSLLKLVATHPSALVEEFMDIVPYLVTDEELIVEVLHSILDLPVLSAIICLHQTPLLVQAGIKVPALLSVRQMVEVQHKHLYQHCMRAQATPGQTDALLEQYANFWTTLCPILTLGLVQVSSQVAPLLLEVFLDSVTHSNEVNYKVLPALLARIPLLCPLPTYQSAVLRVLPQYITRVSTRQPELLDNPCITRFLSVTNHTKLCPQLFESLVNAVGDHIKTEEAIRSTFETLEAVLREMMVESVNRDHKLQTSVCTSLAKLSSRQGDLIPRAIVAFEKLEQSLLHSTDEETQTLLHHAKKLIRILKNPRIASVVLSPSSKEDTAIAALMRVLFQFLE